MPQPRPSDNIRRQSASFWFQLAACERARHWATCSAPSACSVFAVTCLEVSRLAEVRHAALDPVGLPVEHAREWHAGGAEELLRRSRVDQPGGRRFFSDDGGLAAEALAELLGERAHAE